MQPAARPAENPASRAAIADEADKLSAFTFWIGNSLFAIDLRNVLSIEQEDSVIQPTPFGARGELGIIKHRGIPVRVFDLADFLGLTSSSEQMTALIEALVAREQDHIDWIDALEQSIRSEVPFTKARDPHQCAFGKWYDAFHSHDDELMEILARFDVPHKQIHSLADRLLGLRDAGRMEQALQILERERSTTLALLRRLFGRARGQIRERIKSVLLFITTDGKTPCLALRLNEIKDMVEFPSSALTVTNEIGIGDSEHLADVFIGYIDSGNERDSLLFDIDGLLAAMLE